MAKTIKLNEDNVKKYAVLITVENIVLIIISLCFFFVPLNGNSIIGIVENVIDGEEISEHYAVCLIYGLLIAYSIISSLIKVVFFKGKTVINTESKEEMKKSRFIKFVMNNNRAIGLPMLMHMLYFYYHLAGFLFFDVGSMDHRLFLPYLALFFTYIIIVITFMITQGKLIATVNEFRPSSNISIIDSIDSERLGVDMNKASDSTPKTSMKDQKSNLDALLKYKKLYESGAITEEEYNAKKDELLNK